MSNDFVHVLIAYLDSTCTIGNFNIHKEPSHQVAFNRSLLVKSCWLEDRNSKGRASLPAVELGISDARLKLTLWRPEPILCGRLLVPPEKLKSRAPSAISGNG